MSFNIELRSPTSNFNISLASGLAPLSLTEASYVRHTGTPINIWTAVTDKFETAIMRHTGYPTKVWAAKNLASSTLNISSNVSKIWSLVKAYTETINLSHVYSRIWAIFKLVSDTMNLSNPAISRIWSIIRSYLDNFNIIDALSNVYEQGEVLIQQAMAEIITLASSFASVWSIYRTINNTISNVDSFVKAWASKKSLTEASWLRQTGFPTKIWNVKRSVTELFYRISDTEALPGLVLQYHMDDGSGTITIDSSGNNNTGTLLPVGSVPTWSSGKYNGGLSFDGINNYVNGGISPVLHTTTGSALTILGWVKSTKNDATIAQGIIGKANLNGSECGWFLSKRIDNKFYFQVRCHGVYTRNDQDTYSNNSYTDNDWHHLAGVLYSNGSSAIYVDSVEQTAHGTIGVFDPALVTIPLVVGTGYGDLPLYMGYIERFKGTLDEIQIYNHVALSTAQIQTIYNDTHTRYDTSFIKEFKRLLSDVINLSYLYSKIWESHKEIDDLIILSDYPVSRTLTWILDLLEAPTFADILQIYKQLILSNSINLMEFISFSMKKILENNVIIGDAYSIISGFKRFLREAIRLLDLKYILAPYGIYKAIVTSSIRKVAMLDTGIRKASIDYMYSYTALKVYNRIVGKIKRLLSGK